MSVTADVIEAEAASTDPVTHDYGDQALLLEFDSTAEVLAWTEAIREADLLGVLDIVPGVPHRAGQAGRTPYQAPTRQRLGTAARAAEAVSDSTAPADGDVDVEIEVDLRRSRPRRGGPPDRTDTRAGRRCAHRYAVAGRIRRIRTGFRVSGRRRRPPGGAAAGRAADQGSRRLRRAGGRIQRRLPAGVARRLAADRAHRRACCGTSTARVRRC